MFYTLINRNINVFLIFLVLSGVCYGLVINGPFLFDDEHFILKNRFIHSLNHIPDIYTTSVTEGAHIEGNFYRPNQQLVYAIIYNFFKSNSAVPYHSVTILFHFVNSCLLFLLLIQLSFGRTASFIASLIFLIHPIQTEAVSYISGLADPMSLCFLLMGMTLFIKGMFSEKEKQRMKHLTFSTFFFIIALFTKENMVILLPLSSLVAFFIYRRDNRRVDRYLILSLSIYTFLAIGYVSLKLTLFNFSEAFGLSSDSNLYTENLHIRLFTFISILWEYACLIFYPNHLHYEKPYMAYEMPFTPQGIFGLCLISFFLFAIVRFNKCKELFLGLGWFFGALIPYIGIIPLNAMYIEHWLYVPIIGISILMAVLYEKLNGTRFAIIFLVALIPVASLLVVRSIYRNKEWKDAEKFYLNELEHSKPSIRVVNNLGMYYDDKGNIKKAIFYYEKAKKLGNYVQPYHNIAGIYTRLSEEKRMEGNHDLQIEYVNKALDEYYNGLLINPNFIYSLKNVYSVYKSFGQIDRAKKFEKLIFNLQKGGVNSPEDIMDAMMQKDE